MAMKGLNLGSGQRPFRSADGVEWTNVDAQARWNPDLVARAESLPGIADASVDFVVAHHVLEHYGCGESAGLVREAFRVLRPWGSFIVCVPDARELARGWLQGRLSDQVYFTNVYGAFMTDDADRHKWGFTPATLRESLLSAAPWRAVVEFDFRAIPGADLARDWWILALEAIR